MSYLLKSKTKHGIKWKFVFIVVLFCLLSLLLYFLPNFTRNTSSLISKPLWLLRQTIITPAVSIKNFFVSRNDLIGENLFLKEEMAVLKLKEIDYEVLSKEFEELKNQLGRKGDSAFVVARVLSKPPYSPYDTLIIDAGSVDNIFLGDRVYFSDNIIVGLVKNVTPRTSMVELFSSGGTKQETTLSRTGASFVLTGAGGANFELEVPKDTDILWGDTFLYPRFSPSIVGSVYYIDVNSQSSFKKIYIRIPENIFSAKYVFVEKIK